MSLAEDIRRAARLSPRQQADLLRATAELGLARLRLAFGSPASLFDPPEAQAVNTMRKGSGALVDRVAFAVPRAAARVPWRADCLVQALAARRWLNRGGIESSLRLGARKGGEQLDAHAWLTVGKRVVVGGDPGPYAPFAPSAPS